MILKAHTGYFLCCLYDQLLVFSQSGGAISSLIWILCVDESCVKISSKISVLSSNLKLHFFPVHLHVIEAKVQIIFTHAHSSYQTVCKPSLLQLLGANEGLDGV